MRKVPVSHVTVTQGSNAKPSVRGKPRKAAEEEPLSEPSEEPIMMRPDGYYWRAPNGKQEFGPFESLELALADRVTADEEAPEPGETLQEAEDELGISDWIDPETGELAEGQSQPRFEE